jgi:CheY-like chemotaxis protein
MSLDLVSLRLLLVVAAPSQRDLWQKAAAMASVPLEFIAESARNSVVMLRRGGVDICVVDAALTDSDKDAVADAARKAQPAPLLFASVMRDGKCPAGINAALPRPASVDDARKLVEICVRAKVPSRVLIVDDSGTMRSLVRKVLSASRFALDIEEAAEGIVALDQLDNERYDLVLLEYSMPDVDGVEILSEIKRRAPNVSVVIMTTGVSDDVIERAQAAGALAFLKKPFYPADIDTVLERHFGLHGPMA